MPAINKAFIYWVMTELNYLQKMMLYKIRGSPKPKNGWKNLKQNY